MTIIHLSETAKQYIQSRIQTEAGLGLRLTIKKTGCSGFSCHPNIINEINKEDIVIQFDQVTIYIDPKWSHFLDGINIDFIEDNKLGLKQKKLSFTHPKEKNRCGCGESFQIEDGVSDV